MRIALNLLYLIPGCVGGTERYALSLVQALSAIDHTNEYLVFVNREGCDVDIPVGAANVSRVVCRVKAIHRSARYAWEQAVLPFQLRALKVDVVHSLGYVAPLMTGCGSVVTVPDLNYAAISEYLPIQKRLLLPIPRFVSAQSARRADRVITISEFSKDELVRGLHLDSRKVVVTHLGPRVQSAAAERQPSHDIRAQYCLPSHYIVAFGGSSRHKNIVRLVAAFKRIAQEFPHSLVLLGHLPSDVHIDGAAESSDMKRRVLHLGYVPDAHVTALLEHAELFVLPSLYEGFGLPVLEAQQAGVAVACSTAGSLPEVAGRGAVYFDPTSVESIATTIARCLGDGELRGELRALGLANLDRFCWERTAELTLDVYRRVALERASRR